MGCIHVRYVAICFDVLVTGERIQHGALGVDHILPTPTPVALNSTL